MIPLFTSQQAKEIDRYTIEHEPVSPFALVERAAEAFVTVFCGRFPRQGCVFVFAGQGNNGADALAIARLLADEAYKVEVYLFNTGSGELSPECRANRDRLKGNKDIGFQEITGSFAAPELGKQDVVIDGLFGTGLNRPLTGGFAAVVNYINRSEATVVAVDTPSGLFGEDNRGNHPEAVVRADVTVSFGFPKLAFLLPGSAEYAGQWETADIGLHPAAVAATDTPYALLTKEAVASLLRPRNRFSHKGTYGHALLIAGSRDKTGASLLAARACLRSGAGMLTVHVPQGGGLAFNIALPEAMLDFDPHGEYFTAVPDLTPYAAIAAGPGMGQSAETKDAFVRLLDGCEKPMIIDADGINLIASDPDLIPFIPPRSILTPHPKEFDRLAGESTDGYDRLQKAREFAAEHTLYIVLKGHHTAVNTPEGKTYFNNSGNPGMATAGSGDVLTGIMLGLLAQGYEPEAAALLAVYLHGLAGDLAVAARSEESLIAGDITEMLGKAFQQLHAANIHAPNRL